MKNVIYVDSCTCRSTITWHGNHGVVEASMIGIRSNDAWPDEIVVTSPRTGKKMRFVTQCTAPADDHTNRCYWNPYVQPAITITVIND